MCWRFFALTVLLLFCCQAEPEVGEVATSAPEEGQEPVIFFVREQPGYIRLPDGHFKFLQTQEEFIERTAPAGCSLPGDAVSDVQLPLEDVPSTRLMLGQGGEVHAFYSQFRGDRTGEIAVERFIDLWHARTTADKSQWAEPQAFFLGYCGALMDFKQLENGRILVPFGSWIGGRPRTHPTGPNEVVVFYSDDLGTTWNESPARLTSPIFEGYNGSNYGACEPTIVELPGGLIWMLFRTQTGFLFESFSEDGVEWSEAKPSRFHASTGPPGLLKLPDGRILVIWNNCEMPSRVDGAGVYGGRDEIHAAISDDQGKTWRGFRTFYRDPHRSESPPKRGDRGTAYPAVTYSEEGSILVLTGQGGRRNLIGVDPAWLTVTQASDDFSNGLHNWSVFKHFGPAVGWWQDRVQGPELISHPSDPACRVLHIRRSDEKPGDGAVWNFPLGRSGMLKLGIQLQEGFGGAEIALNDRFFNPTDERAAKFAVCAVEIDPSGQIGPDTRLDLKQWYNLAISWDLDQNECSLELDDTPAFEWPVTQATLNGVSYLHLRSTSESIDPAGLLLDKVFASISDPIAAEVTDQQKLEAAKEYAADFYGQEIYVDERQERDVGFN